MMNDYYELMKKRPELFVNADDDCSIKIITDREEIAALESVLDKKIGIVYEDEYICVVRDAVIFPGGTKGTYIRLLNSSDKQGTVIIPVCNGKILFLRHFRHSLRRYCIELPRGFGEDGLTTAENAAKELWEECNLKYESCHILGQITSDTGIMSSEPYVVLMEVKDSFAKVNDSAEAIKEIMWLTLEEIQQFVADGKIADGYSLAAMFLLLSKKQDIKI